MFKSLSKWFASRADIVTLGVQGVILDEKSRVLLIRHSYRPGWHFPGGGVERGEEIEQALAREVLEETGVIIDGTARLFGAYANFEAYPGDHIALFIVSNWRRDAIPAPNAEIAEQGFFARDALPDALVRGAAARLKEIFEGAEISEYW